MNYPERWRAGMLALRPVPPPGSSDHVIGRADAPVTLIEYADFQCPFCASMHPAVEDLVNQGTVRWIYRHAPLTEIHPRALEAAEASECAADQQKFWEFAAATYSRQADLDTLEFAGLADSLGLARGEFARCLAQSRHRAGVIRDAARAMRHLRIQATPTWFVNGDRHEGFRSAAHLESVIAAKNKND